jgi:hypothetical protein
MLAFPGAYLFTIGLMGLGASLPTIIEIWIGLVFIIVSCPGVRFGVRP